MLQRMKRVEKSAYVKEQINELEERVLRAQRTYNELRTFLRISDKAVLPTDQLSSLSNQLQ